MFSTCPHCGWNEEKDIVAKYEKDGIILKIKRDDDPMNPRIDWDNMGIMVCFHNKRYDLGDKTNLKSSEFNGWYELADYLASEKDAIVILPLYLYEHSGITISTGSFSCPWDSGQIGFIYTTKKKIKEYMGIENPTPEQVKNIEQQLKNEVESYDDYLTGECYRFELEDKDGNHIDSCGGFLGSDFKEIEKSIKDHLDVEHKDILNYEVK